MTTEQSLRDLGLNDKEVRLYLTLIKHGDATPTQLAKLTKINRATVYSAAKSLQSKGLIAEDSTGKTILFTPLPPRHLSEIIERPRRELQEKEHLVKKTIEELSMLASNKTYPVPRIQFVGEPDIEDFLYNNTIKWQESIIANDGVWWGFNDRDAATQYEEWIKWVWTTPQSKHKNFSLRVISNESETERKMAKRIIGQKRTVQFWSDVEFASSMWVAGDYVIMIVNKQQPHYLFEIHDKALAQNLRQIFRKMWE